MKWKEFCCFGRCVDTCRGGLFLVRRKLHARVLSGNSLRKQVDQQMMFRLQFRYNTKGDNTISGKVLRDYKAMVLHTEHSIGHSKKEQFDLVQ